MYYEEKISLVPAASQTIRRSICGRRRMKNIAISPEEEERRQIRRERNKLAAARSRKRRLDQTEELIHEMECLEQKQQLMQQEIQELLMEKKQLEFVLEAKAHKATCLVGLEPLVLRDKSSSLEALSPPFQYKQQLFDASLQTLVDQLPKPRCDAIVALSSSFHPQQHTAMELTWPRSLPAWNAEPPIGGINGGEILTPPGNISSEFDPMMAGDTGLTSVPTPQESNYFSVMFDTVEEQYDWGCN